MIIVFVDEKNLGDLGEKEWLRLASENEVFDFLADDDEDIYTLADGNPL